MSRSRVLIILALAFALIGAASTQLSAAAGAVTASAASAAGATPAVPLDPTPVPTPSPYDTITIDPAVTTAVPGGEELTLTVTSTTPVTSLTVQLSDATTGSTMDPAMTPLAGSGTPGQSTWSSGIITTMPLGTYNVTVDASDEGGTTVTGASAGTFAFQETPTVELTVNPLLSYANQHPVLSGTVSTLVPGAASAEPYADEKIVLADSVLGNVTLITDASGGFSFPFTDPQPGETFTVKVLPADTVAAAASAPETFTVSPDQVAMSASLSANTVTYGSKVTVSGAVSYAPGGKSEPFPGETVRIYRSGASSPAATAVTGTGGRFTAVLPLQPASVHWVLQAGGPYLSTATVTLPMKVSLPTVVSGFQATLNPYWQVSFHGCLALSAGIPGAVPSLSGLTIQYAAGPNGPWYTLGAVPSQRSVACGNGGETFSGTLSTPLNYAYYRAWYAGGTNLAGTGYLASGSVKALAWKYEDRITSFSVSPRSVSKDGKLTISGVLQYYSGKWRSSASQQILIILHPVGSKYWYWIAAVHTNSSGQFTATVADPVSATWSAEYQGNNTHLATVAAMVNVTVS